MLSNLCDSIGEYFQAFDDCACIFGTINGWNEYREGTELTGADVVAQLLECCDDDLR